jgi:hypothetical protein
VALMDEQDRYVGLVHRAQQGDQTALGELADLKCDRRDYLSLRTRTSVFFESLSRLTSVFGSVWP